MNYSLILALIFTSLTAQAKVEVLFHPHDPTLERIAEWIGAANHTVDIAMYNMDVTDSSPVIQTLKSSAVQSRLRQGNLKIRLIYEGYDTPAKNKERMDEIEALGIDVRYLGKGVKIHHKFAVLDGDRVVTGSANWSMSSYRNYNENILFFEREPEVTARFHEEFASLWTNCKEHGHSLPEGPGVRPDPSATQSDLEIHFNSPRHLRAPVQNGVYLTEQVVRLLDGAKKEVDIATTRIRLEPVLDAVLRASQRGVQVRILLSQDDYRDLYKRAQWLFNKPGIHLRVKFYNLVAGAYMTYQMHNKFMIVDRSVVMTGSFNWSKSSENNHIENLVEITGAMAQAILPAFENEFAGLWDMGRAELPSYLKHLAELKSRGEKPPCGFTPTALDYEEIRKLLRENRCS